MKDVDSEAYAFIPTEIRAAYVAYLRVTIACQEVSLVPDTKIGITKEKREAHTALRYLQDSLYEMVGPFLSPDHTGQG